jgi:glutathione S-transferase
MITVYSIPGSPFGRAVLAACIETSAPYRLAALGPGQSKSPEHLARHPFGRVPAIEDDGFGLYETQAILRYIDAVHGSGKLTPADAKATARMNQVMGVIDWYFFADGGAKTLVFLRAVAPKFGMPVDEAVVAASIPKAQHAAKVLEGFLAASPYMAGDAFSLADIHAGTQLDMFAGTPEGAEILKESPILAWLARLNARPSFAATTWDRLLEAA